MIDVLSEPGRLALQAFLTPGLLLAFDYDGTLAEITPDPARACMRPLTRSLLEKAAHCHTTLLLTGRSRREALHFLDGVADIRVVGNHGSETDATPNGHVPDAIARWKGQLDAALAPLAGVVIEDKTHSLSVHYRHAVDQEAAGAAVLEATSRLDGARIVGGKCVVNVVPRDALHKGTALLAEARRVRAERAIFVGDDVTDEDVFALDGPLPIFSIRVGEDARSRARYFIHGQAQIDALLQQLIGSGR